MIRDKPQLFPRKKANEPNEMDLGLKFFRYWAYRFLENATNTVILDKFAQELGRITNAVKNRRKEIK